MEERRKRGKELAVQVITIDCNVSALAREAGLAEAVAGSAELMVFTELLIDIVMAQTGHTKAARVETGVPN